MLSRPTRPSPAMVVALLALCVALGGSAIAAKKVVLAPKNSVNSASVINSSLRLADFKKTERAKLRGAKGAKGDTGPAGTPDGYTRTDADARFLAKTDKAADADKLDGIDSSAFAQGGAVFHLFTDGESNASFVGLPGIGQIGFGCASAMTYSFAPSSELSGPVSWEMNDTGNLSSHSTGVGSTYLLNLGSTAHQIVAQFHRGASDATVIMSVFRGASGDGPTDCRAAVQVVRT